MIDTAVKAAQISLGFDLSCSTSWSSDRLRHDAARRHRTNDLWTRTVNMEGQKGIGGLGYSYSGWMVGYLDAGRYILREIRRLDSYIPTGRNRSPGIFGTYGTLWKNCLELLSSPEDLLRLELLEGL